MGARIVPVNFVDTEHCSDLAVTSAATGFPVTNLQSNLSDETWRSTSLATQVITGTFGGDCRSVSCWGLWPAKTTSSLIGATVRVQLYSDAAMLTQVYDSGTLDFFTVTGTVYGTFLWGGHSWGVEAGDRTCRLAPKVRFFSSVVVAAFKITLANGGGVDTTYFEARRLLLGEYLEAPYNAEYGAAPAWASNSEQERSLGGALRRLPRATWRELQFETPLVTEAQRAAWTAACHAADPGREVLVSLFEESDGERLFRDFVVLGSLKVLSPLVWQDVNFHRLQIAIAES